MTENSKRADKPWLFKPGVSGNPGGRPKAESQVRELARQYTEDAIQTLADLMLNGRSENVRKAAADSILDRAWGKPAQELALTGADGGPLEITARPIDTSKLTTEELEAIKIAAKARMRLLGEGGPEDDGPSSD